MFRDTSFLLKAALWGLCLVFVPFSVTAQPAWVNGGLHPAFNIQTHLSAVGSGHSRHVAERNALGQLALQFGARVQVDERMAESYRQAVQGGAAATWTHYIRMESDIVITGGIDNLIGAEIGDFWDDGRGTTFALAVLNRANAVRIYSESIRANQDIIRNLTNMSAAERNTLSGFSRYELAAAFADMNVSYGQMLSVLGAPQYVQGLIRGEVFLLEAQEIVRAITIGINIRNDRAGRIQGAFAGVFSALGFRTGAPNPRYVLEVDISFQPVDTPGSQFVFTRMELSANLTESGTGMVLLPYHLNFREGHRNLPEAENRALLYAARRIRDEYSDILSDYLSRLIPRR